MREWYFEKLGTHNAGDLEMVGFDLYTVELIQ